MKPHYIPLFALTFVAIAACSPPTADEPAVEATPESVDNQAQDEAPQSIDIAPGLSARILRAGDGQAAQAGDLVEVHYTGWLFDAAAADTRGEKFDSSIDRGQRFQFPLGAGRVIRGWDQGVAGMQIGELRELTIEPELAYGDRGAGSLIPPGATLVFEVELFDARSLSE